MVQIKSAVLEIVHEIPEVTKLLVSEEDERSQVEEINQEEKASFFFFSIKAGKGPDNIRWTHMQKEKARKSVALPLAVLPVKFDSKLRSRDRFAPN